MALFGPSLRGIKQDDQASHLDKPERPTLEGISDKVILKTFCALMYQPGYLIDSNEIVALSLHKPFFIMKVVSFIHVYIISLVNP